MPNKAAMMPTSKGSKTSTGKPKAPLIPPPKKKDDAKKAKEKVDDKKGAPKVMTAPTEPPVKTKK